MQARTRQRPLIRIRRITQRPSRVTTLSTAHENLKTKTCEEIETGGFGGFDETMATSNRCTERATEFCNSCAKNLCGVHYDALHRGHDSFTRETSGHGLAHH